MFILYLFSSLSPTFVPYVLLLFLTPSAQLRRMDYISPQANTFPYVIKSNQICFLKYFFRTYLAKNIVCTTEVGHFGTRPMYSVLVSSSHAPSARAWLRLGLNTLVLAPKDLLYLLDTQYTINHMSDIQNARSNIVTLRQQKYILFLNYSKIFGFLWTCYKLNS